MMNFYNQISKGYNELHGKEQLKKINIIENEIEIKNNDLLLDVGCGTGISSQFNCEVIGIDKSIELLRQNNKVSFNSIAEKLPFKEDTFDLVISVTAIHNFKDVEESLKEMKRVGKKRFVFSVLKKSKRFNEIERLIKKYFRVGKRVEEDKDLVFFCKKLQTRKFHKLFKIVKFSLV